MCCSWAAGLSIIGRAAAVAVLSRVKLSGLPVARLARNRFVVPFQ